MKQLRTRRAVALLAGLMVTAGSVAVLPAGATSSGPGKSLASYYDQKANWAACDPGEVPPGYPPEEWAKIWVGMECADIVVPLNYRDPGAGDLSIAISRRKAKDPAKRQGVLLLNPGGPGGPGLEMPYYLKDEAIGGPFDLVGFDPRGTGGSTGLDCEVPDGEASFDTRPSDDLFAKFAADAKAQEEACAKAGGGIRKYINTNDTARDMDVIRAAMGEKKINYLGFSYGTKLGAAYGSLFPSKLNRSVLDSSMHPDWDYYEASMQQAVAARENFDEWAAWVAQRNSRYGFGKTRAEVIAHLDAVRAKLKANPVPWPDAPPGYPEIDGSFFDNILGGASGDRAGWVEATLLIGQIRDAAQQQGKAALSSDTSKALKAFYGVIKDTYQGVFQAVSCETDWPKDLAVYNKNMREFRTKYPYGRGAMAAAPTNCTYRSFTPPEKPVKPQRKGYPTGLVIQAEFDPATQYDGGPAMADRLKDNLVSIKDEGTHGQYGRNACATKKINDYLIKGILPGSRTVCAGAPRPDVPADGAPGAKAQKDPGGSLEQRIKAHIKNRKLDRGF